MVKVPDSPYVEVKLGDYLMNNAPPNQKIQSMTYTRKNIDKANRVEFVLVDDNIIELEQKMIDNRDNLVFQYGWGRGNLSDKYSCTILDYTTEIYNEARVMTLNVQATTRAVDAHLKDGTKEYIKDGEPMRIHEIIEDIAEEFDWEVGQLEKTAPVIDVESSRKVEDLSDEEEVAFERGGISVIKFIKNELIPNAMTEDGRAGFNLWFEDKVDKPVINFAPVDYSKEKDYEYVIGGQDSRVQSFTFQNAGRLMLSMGADVLKAEFVDDISHDMKSVEKSNKDVKEFAEDRIIDDGRGLAYTNESAGSEDEVEKKLTAIKSKSNQFAYRATMDIRGNPELGLWKTINLIIPLPGSKDKLYHASGKYKVWKITDTIQEGNFVSNVEMRRESTKAEEKETG